MSFAKHIKPVTYFDATPTDVEDWLATLNAPRTRHAYRSDLVVFYRWAIKRRQTTSDPTAETEDVRLPKLLPRPVPPEAIPALIAHAPSDRLRLCIALAAFAGLRRAEIANLTTGDVNTVAKPPLLVVREGKGRKDRVVPLHPELAAMLSMKRVNGKVIGWGPSAVGRNVALYLRRCGYDATCHQLRHSFGTELARATAGNVILVGRLMGHSSVTTTQGYIGWAGGEGARAVADMYSGAA